MQLSVWQICFTLLCFLCTNYTCITNVKSGSIPDRMCAFLKTEIFSLHRDWAKFLNQGGFVFNLLCCLKSWNLPWCRVIYALCMELWLHTKCLRWKIDQSWWEEASTGEQAESWWWYSIQFKCILLVLSISHIMLGQARGQFLFSEGFKKQIYCITDGEKQSGFLKHQTLSGKFFQFFRTAIMMIAAALTSLKNAVCIHYKCNGD